jgi:hypothetical protein
MLHRIWNRNKEVQRYIKNKIDLELDRIYPVSGECRYNFRCHLNSVHEAVKNNDEYIIMGFYFCNNQPIIHFYNYQKGVIIDNTLGCHALQYKHYIYKRVYKKDFKNIETVFLNFRKQIRKSLPWYLRIFSTYNC